MICEIAHTLECYDPNSWKWTVVDFIECKSKYEIYYHTEPALEGIVKIDEDTYECILKDK